MNRQAQGLVMFVLGYAVLHASFTDLYLRYVRAGLRPLLIAAGVALIVMAIATFWYEFRAFRAHRDGTGEPAHDDGHGHLREPRIAWLFVLPLLALIVVVPPALGSYAADRSGTSLPRPFGFPPLSAADPAQLSVLDYATRAVYDNGHSLGVRRIKMTGFITLGNGGRPYLTRMVLNCCAADALPVKVALSGQIPASVRPDVWLEVVGTYSKKEVKDEINGGTIPFVDVSQARAVPTPDDQYES
jgi:uncharacterized repeat protein (TIGR03943 family)